MPDKEPKSYICREKCGAITGVVVESFDYKKESSNLYQRWVKQKKTIEHLSDKDIKLKFLKCPKNNEQKYNQDTCKNCPENNVDNT